MVEKENRQVAWGDIRSFGVRAADMPVKTASIGAFICRSILSTVMLTLAVTVVLDALFGHYPNLMPSTLHPGVSFAVLVLSMILLALNEAKQVSVLALQQSELPPEYKTAQYNLDSVTPPGQPSGVSRLFVGQTMQVVLLTFVIAQLTTFETIPAHWGEFIGDLCKSGILGVLVMASFAQLLPSTFANQHPAGMLQHAPFIGFTIKLSLLIESTGIANFSHCMKDWLLRSVGLVSPDEICSYWDTGVSKVKTSVSFLVVGVSILFVIIWQCLLSADDGLYVMFGRLTLLVFLLFCVFILEGLKVACVLKINLSRDVYDSELLSANMYDLFIAGASDGPLTPIDSPPCRGIERFLIGRQLLVVPINFVLARLCSGTLIFPLFLPPSLILIPFQVHT